VEADASVTELVVEHRFRGPPSSGNGGYTCGSLARSVPGVAEVTLRVPPPLDRPLAVERSGGGAVAIDGDVVVAEATAATVELEVPVRPGFEEAERAAAAFRGFAQHPFASCFVCGPDRDPGDGLRIFPGPRGDVVASPWVPDESLLDPVFVWAALDCPGGFAVGYPDVELLLGRLAVRIDRLPRAGERCVAIGWPLGHDGRKRHAATALVSAGEVLALGRATWIAPAGED
jgi:hypothetical protein